MTAETKIRVPTPRRYPYIASAPARCYNPAHCSSADLSATLSFSHPWILVVSMRENG